MKSSACILLKENVLLSKSKYKWFSRTLNNLLTLQRNLKHKGYLDPKADNIVGPYQYLRFMGTKMQMINMANLYPSLLTGSYSNIYVKQ